MEPTRANDQLPIGEVSRRTGVAPSALRFYEEQGLIASVRTSGGQRRYERHMLRRISLVMVAKRLGMPLAEIARAFESVPLDRAPTQEAWQQAARAWRRRLQSRRRALDRLEHELTGCIGCGCLSMRACSLLNPNDALSADGPGPRRLELDHVDEVDLDLT